ncbi:hypothetical protein HYU10_02845 [Candidatus Woesearchaeota archaeon]|nr:hypothetical protein [Candidatus Woesearchaeota archaeon]
MQRLRCGTGLTANTMMAESAQSGAVMMDIKKEIHSNQIVLSILSNYYYNESLLKVLKGIGDKKICYVALNKTADSLIKSFRANGIGTDNIFFIDAVTRPAVSGKPSLNSILVSSPYALTELGIAISEILKSKAFEFVVFDSLSTLNIYQQENKSAASKFTSHIINKIRNHGHKGVFTCLENDADSELVKKSLMYVDKVLDIRDMKEEIQKQTAKNASAAALVVIGLAAFSILMRPSSPTAMAIAERNSIGSMLNPATVLLLLAAMLALAIGIVRRLSRQPDAIGMVLNKLPMERIGKIAGIKNPKALRKQFRDRINGWLDSLK